MRQIRIKIKYMLQSEKISSLRCLVTTVLLLLNINILSCKQPAEKEVNKISELQSQIKENDSSAYVVELVADNLFVPWSIVFTAPERMLFTERNGSLRIIRDGKLIVKPLKDFEEVSSKGEEGLMGLALDPDYKNNKYIYLSYAYPEDDELKVRKNMPTTATIINIIVLILKFLVLFLNIVNYNSLLIQYIIVSFLLYNILWKSSFKYSYLI